jgi:hypothetical protein
VASWWLWSFFLFQLYTLIKWKGDWSNFPHSCPYIYRQCPFASLYFLVIFIFKNEFSFF